MGTRDLFRYILIFFAAAVFLIGCAATNSYMEEKSSGENKENTDIDQLLGSDKSGSEESINEDDVLRLLGVNEENKSDGSITQSEESESEAGIVSENAGKTALSQNIAESSTLSQGQTSSKAERAIPAWKSDSYKDRYQEALQTYRSKNFREAIQKFEALLATDYKNSLAGNCQYWIGEAYYDQGNYTQAIMAFEKVFTFPNSNKNDSAQLKLGFCYLKMNDTTKAKDEFQKLINNYPTSEYISIAKRRIAQIGESSPSP
jgi:tol-pal system protein YbgF